MFFFKVSLTIIKLIKNNLIIFYILKSKLPFNCTQSFFSSSFQTSHHNPFYGVSRVYDNIEGGF